MQSAVVTLEAVLPASPYMPYTGTSKCVRAIRTGNDDRIFAGGWEAGTGDVTLGYTLFDSHFIDVPSGVPDAETATAPPHSDLRTRYYHQLTQLHTASHAHPAPPARNTTSRPTTSTRPPPGAAATPRAALFGN